MVNRILMAKSRRLYYSTIDQPYRQASCHEARIARVVSPLLPQRILALALPLVASDESFAQKRCGRGPLWRRRGQRWGTPVMGGGGGGSPMGGGGGHYGGHRFYGRPRHDEP